MSMLIAEKFVLLALAPDGRVARGSANQSAAAVGVTGALLTELAQDGHIDLADGRIRVTGTRPSHPLLIQALENVAPHDGKKLKSRLSRIKHTGWREVVDMMVEQGDLGRESHTFRPTRHPVRDQAAHAALLDHVRAEAIGNGPLDAETATLLALAGPSQMLEVVAPDRADRKTAKRRIAEAAEQVPAAAAVKYVIDAMTTTAAGAAVVGASASAGSC
jgi:Golgi phosphoprotein 3 (GPP34)